MNKTRVYYQPYLRGFNEASSELPDDLYSFEAFASKEECEEWMQNHGYGCCDYFIDEYHDDDIEDVTIIDRYDNIIEVNES